MARRLVIVVLVVAACFHEPSNLDTGGVTASAGSESGTVSTSGPSTTLPTSASNSDTGDTDPDPLCPDGQVRVPDQLPDGVAGWSVVAQGEPMNPHPPCPGGAAPPLFANATPSCRCSCNDDDAGCQIGYEVFQIAACMESVIDSGAVETCTSFDGVVPSLRITAIPSAGGCDAHSQPLPGPEAQPVSVCDVPVESGCIDVPEGFTGPCFVATGMCPADTEQLLVVAEVVCDDCPPCSNADACAAKRVELFPERGCVGVPTVIAPDGSCVTEPYGSAQIAEPEPMAPTGCDDATGSLAEQLVCCLPGR